MTIRITVKNEDSRETAIVAVKCLSLDGTPNAGNPDVKLKGGESVEKHVHSGQKLEVAEVQNG